MKFVYSYTQKNAEMFLAEANHVTAVMDLQT